jgi:type II secretion system protein G
MNSLAQNAFQFLRRSFLPLVVVEVFLASARAAEPSPEQKMIRMIQCLDHLHQIGQGLVLYASDHNGSYPPDLGTLLVDQKMELTTFVCPAAPSGIPANWKTLAAKEQAAWVNAHTDYVYLGAKRGITMKANEPLAYEKDDDHEKVLNVLFGDGHVSVVTLEDARRQLGTKVGTERTTTRVAPTAGEPPAVPLITLDQAKSLYARWDLAAIKTALFSFELDNGRFPTSQEGLKALVEKPSGLPQWRQYLSAIPRDPWDHEYHYSSPGTGGNDFNLSSAGPDGKPGTADDVQAK